MRQRRLKDLDERKKRLDCWFVKNPQELKGNWRNYFGGQAKKLYVEIGCGKGQFITNLAENNKEANYIAIETQESVIVKAMDKAEQKGLTNLAFISVHLDDITKYFDEAEVDGIFLNFSDPWPKARHKKRRLTHRNFMQKYDAVVKNGGFLAFKTDNDDLFKFTIEEINELGFEILEYSEDLHNSKFVEANVMTEYEEKFSNRGKNINYVKARIGGSNMILAQQNNRTIPKADKIFALNEKAKKMIQQKGKDAVINATVGALLDDDGNLAVMQTVIEEIKKLGDADFAEYAPIGGIPEFKEAMKKAVFHEYKTNSFVEVVATPGGTGGIRNTVANYSKLGDAIITSDWYWATYKTICEEIGRNLETYELFNDEQKFNLEGFADKIYEVAKRQKRVVILLNTPAHNPTGYALNCEEWQAVIDILNDEKLKEVPVALFVDAAYIDFAGNPEEVREFLPQLESLNENILPIIGYSASKTFTAYGMRTGAMICMAKTEEIAQEFKKVCEFSSRNSWSNCNRSGQKVIANIYASKQALQKVEKERADFRDMLLARGKVFEEAAKAEGIDAVPFISGFFICIACENPVEISDKLAERGVFVVPLAKGIRISVASISEEKCKKTAKVIAEVLD